MAAMLGRAEGTARAEPQASIGLTAGAIVQRVIGPGAPGTSLDFGARVDVLWLRERNGQMALGPFVDATTAAFLSADVGGGLEWLVPLTEDVPVVLSVGGFARDGQGRSWAPGAEGTAFVGPRSFNFHSWYGMANGLFLQARWLPGAATVDVVVGAQVDLELMTLPLLLLAEVLDHGT